MEKEKEIKIADAIRIINRNNIRALIIGRRAVILYGGPVLTADYDIWIDSKEKKQTLDILEGMGIELSRPTDTKQPIVTGYSGMRKFDLFFHKSITNKKGLRIDFEKVYENSELIDDPSANIAFRVPSIDDLINMKKIRDYNVKDEQDIEYLLKAKKLKNK